MLELAGISGKAGAGKDYVGRYMRRFGYYNVGFAWALKMDAMAQGIGTREELFVTKPPHIRAWLQDYGTTARRHDPEFWIKRLDALIQTLHYEGGIQRFVITDVRFRNEADYIRQRGGKLIRVQHGDRPYPLHGTDLAGHMSEIGLDSYHGWDLVLINGLRVTDDQIGHALYAAGLTARN
jgi:Deoxynucleotide monophosphate kinase